MSRRTKFLIWLTTAIALLGLSYASLPWIVSGLVKSQLTEQGASDIQLQVSYPGWRGINIQALAFTVTAGEYQASVEVPDIEVAYHFTELITGSVAQIRVPVITARMTSITHSAPSASGGAALPLATLLSGQWLSQLPVGELLLGQLNLDARIAADAVYTLQLSGELRDAKLQLNGDIRLPKPARRPIVFSINAQATGEARLLVSSIDQTATPIVSVTVNPVAVDQDRSKSDQIDLNGALTAELDTLMPMLEPLLAGREWMPRLGGYLTGQWQAQVDETNWDIMGEATVMNLSGRWRDQVLPPSEWTAKFDVNPQRANMQTTLRVANQAMVLATKGVVQLASGHGHADFTLQPVEFSKASFVLSQLQKDWPYPFDITSGRMSANGRLVWQQAFDAQMVLKLDKVGGLYHQQVFAGLSGEVALSWLNSKSKGLHTSKDAVLNLDFVDVGFPVEKIELGFALAASPKEPIPIVQMKTFAAELLGGRAYSEPFEFDFGRDKNAFVIQVKQIGLNDIMELEQQEGLQGSGKLDGHIPVEIFNGDIVVKHAQLSAVAPGGSIRYTPTAKVAAMAKSNASLGLMVNALSNFQYQVLDVISDYEANGDLTLKVRLEGKSLDWQRGQPINLNLNLEENIPTLLRSLQLSDELSRQVRERYLGIEK